MIILPWLHSCGLQWACLLYLPGVDGCLFSVTHLQHAQVSCSISEWISLFSALCMTSQGCHCPCRDGESTRQHLITCSEQYLLKRTADGYTGSSAEDLAADQKQALYASDVKQNGHANTYSIAVRHSHSVLGGHMLDALFLGLQARELANVNRLWLIPFMALLNLSASASVSQSQI